MPAWPAVLITAKRIPWKTLFVAGQQVYERSKKFRDNLTDAERARLGEILRKSKGRRANLTDKEAGRLKELVVKGAKGTAGGR